MVANGAVLRLYFVVIIVIVLVVDCRPSDRIPDMGKRKRKGKEGKGNERGRRGDNLPCGGGDDDVVVVKRLISCGCLSLF